MDAHTNRPGQTAGPSHGSRTMTIHDVPLGEQAGQGGSGAGQEDRAEGSSGVLRLRGGGNTRRVVWSEETVDNEGMGKKKSKICCIYHKPKAFDESSDESSSGSSDDSSASNSSLDSNAEPSDTSTSRHGSLDSGVNASTSLREARERKKRSDGCEGPAGHECRRRSKKRQGAGRTGGRTTVQTQQEQVDSNVPPTKPAPNAYERGIA